MAREEFESNPRWQREGAETLQLTSHPIPSALTNVCWLSLQLHNSHVSFQLFDFQFVLVSVAAAAAQVFQERQASICLPDRHSCVKLPIRPTSSSYKPRFRPDRLNFDTGLANTGLHHLQNSKVYLWDSESHGVWQHDWVYTAALGLILEAHHSPGADDGCRFCTMHLWLDPATRRHMTTLTHCADMYIWILNYSTSSMSHALHPHLHSFMLFFWLADKKCRLVQEGTSTAATNEGAGHNSFNPLF